MGIRIETEHIQYPPIQLQEVGELVIVTLSCLCINNFIYAAAGLISVSVGSSEERGQWTFLITTTTSGSARARAPPAAAPSPAPPAPPPRTPGGSRGWSRRRLTQNVRRR